VEKEVVEKVVINSTAMIQYQDQLQERPTQEVVEEVGHVVPLTDLVVAPV